MFIPNLGVFNVFFGNSVQVTNDRKTTMVPKLPIFISPLHWAHAHRVEIHRGKRRRTAITIGRACNGSFRALPLSRCRFCLVLLILIIPSFFFLLPDRCCQEGTAARTDRIFSTGFCPTAPVPSSYLSLLFLFQLHTLCRQDPKPN